MILKLSWCPCLLLQRFSFIMSRGPGLSFCINLVLCCLLLVVVLVVVVVVVVVVVLVLVVVVVVVVGLSFVMVASLPPLHSKHLKNAAP